MRRPLLACVRHELPDELGLAAEQLLRGGLDVAYVELWRGDAIPDAREVDGVLVLGGDMNADEVDRYPYLERERQLFRDCVDHGVPALGICLGGQILARAFGADVHAGGARECGFYPLRPTAEGLADHLVAPFTDGTPFFRWHSDGFDVPAAGRLLLGGREESPNQAFRVGDACWGLQFHPELTFELLGHWLDASVDTLESRAGMSRAEIEELARRHLPEQQRRSDEFFTRFATIVRESAVRRAGGREEAGPSSRRSASL